MKSKTKPKQDSYVVLQRWMRTELGLKGNELTVYATIYGFSQDGESVYKGGYGYLADWTGLSENGARNIVKELVARGLLKELKTMVGGILVNQYVAVRNPVPETVPEDGADPYKNCTPTKIVPLQKVYPDPYKKCIQTPTKSVDRKYIGKPKGKYTPSRARSDGGENRTPLDVFAAWCSGAVPEQEQPRLMEQLKRFDTYRAARRGKAWDAQAAQAVCDKLTQLADEAKTTQRTDYMIASIRQSIEAGWSVLDHPKSWGHAAGQRAKPSSLRVERSPDEIAAAGDWMRTAPLRRPLIRQQKAGAESD